MKRVLDEMTKPVHAWEDELGPDGADTRVCRLGKKAAGRTLDGRTWDEYPASAYPLGLLRHSWDAAP